MVDVLKQLQDIIDDYIAQMQDIHEKRVVLSNKDYALASKEVKCWDVLQQNLKVFNQGKGHVLSEDQQPV